MSGKIMTALHSVMEACGYVQKTGKNAFHGYKYASEADLLDKLRPAMVKHGLLLLPSGQDVRGPDEHGNVTVTVSYSLAHKDGEMWPEKLVAFGCGNDRAKNGAIGDKGLYKALTGANKYLLFKLFQIETGDDPERDAEHEQTPPAVPKSSAEPIADRLIAVIAKQPSAVALGEWWINPKVTDAFDAMSTSDKARVTAAKNRRLADLEQMADDPFESAA